MRVAAAQMALRIYSDEADFAQTVAHWAKRAADAKADLLVFPEDLGLPLAFLDCARAAGRCKTPLSLALCLVLNRIGPILRAAFTPGASPKAAIFLARAQRIRAAYESALSAAAGQSGITIVGGSVPLPGDGPQAGKLLNRCGIFGPDGGLLAMIPKVNLVDMERKMLGMTDGDKEDLRVFTVAGMTVGAAICFDAWQRPVIEHLAQLGAQFIASPQANPLPWPGKEKDANRKGLILRCNELNLWGVQAMGVGEIAGLRFEGQSAIIGPGETGILAEAADHLGEELLVADVG